ncbi:hypothetical protein BMW23_1227 [Bodo saltans virus]|uniref:Uncharacterized protein n=1 Tax=Bodo saltans virus TaxID=2024608 RepID=A0A2H4UWG9_9VIRU|nr:hypothetical protein QJ851_gp1207 [Bodo saltans virus]ATZ81270.1 hypothetical protein BMW23_1227 [Bodo saltans virus]
MNIIMSRDATKSMNGYSYQRLYALYFVTNYYDNNNGITMLKEEGDEDVDLFIDDNNKEVTQIKYYDSNKKESLAQGTGIFKVIESNIKNKTLNKINMYVYQKNNTPYTEIIKLWDDAIKNNNNVIIKYIIHTYMHYYIKSNIKCDSKDKKICKEKNCNCDFCILDMYKLENPISQDDEDIIKKMSLKIKNNIFEDYNKNEDDWLLFFKKFNFLDGKSIDELEKNINDNLKKIYVNDDKIIKENIDIKIDLLRCKIYNSLMTNGFDGNKKINIKTFLDGIKNETKKVLLYKNDELVNSFYIAFNTELNNQKNNIDYIHDMFYKTLKESIEMNIINNKEFIKSNLYNLYTVRNNDKLNKKQKRDINLIISYIYLTTFVLRKDELEYDDIIILVNHSHRVLNDKQNDDGTIKTIKESKPSLKIKKNRKNL